MSNIVYLFKNRVPSQKQVYSNYLQKSGDKGISFNKYRKNNIDLLEIQKYFLSMNEYNILSERCTDNIFKYLNNNLVRQNTIDMKNQFEIINQIKLNLLVKISDLNDNITINKLLKHIIYNLEELEISISNFIEIEHEQLESMMRFEKLVNTILNSTDIAKSLNLIFMNLKLLTKTDFMGRDFSTLLYNAIKESKEKSKYYYYKELTNYVLNIKILNLCKNNFFELINKKYYNCKNNSMLKSKISNLPYDSVLDRYILDDYLISIDGDNAKKIDDALSVEKTQNETFIIGIHITDTYSPENYKLGNRDKLLISKKNVDKIKYSLLQNVKRNAISLFIEITNNGVILEHKLLKTRLKVSKNLSNDDISKIVEDNSIDKILRNTVKNLVHVYNLIDNYKICKNTIPNNIGYSIVEKFMLLYGCIISECFYNNDIPGIYLCLYNGKKGYSTVASNFDVGFKNYCKYSKSTSPIYNDSSLICQFLLHFFYFDKKPDTVKCIISDYLKNEVQRLNKRLYLQ